MRYSILFLVALFAGLARGEEAYFLTDPSLSPDGKTIVFGFEGDLWTTPAAGGPTLRLTGMAGRERRPRFSPDGKWIAFSGDQTGNPEVYVMPAAGGPIRQLTFYDSEDLVDSWSWDSRTVYFTSDRYNNFSAYSVPIGGGTPARLVENYFNTIHGVVVHPGTGEYIFTDTWESLLFASRKRYRGEYNPDLKSWNPATRELRTLTTWAGKDLWPTLDRAGRIYFASDEANGEYNLYRLADGRKEALTSFDTSIRQPQASADGRAVVFEKDYRLWLYDVTTGASRPVPVEPYRNNTLGLDQDFKTTGQITAFDVSPDGRKLAFVSRGRLFAADIKGNFVRQLATMPEGRAVEVNWLQDNLTLVYNQTVDGFLNWFRIAADGKSPEVEITFEQTNNRELSLNRERTRGVYLSGRNEVRILDLKSWQSVTIARDELWGFDNSRPVFSPDGRYVAFTAYRNFERDVLIVNLLNNEAINLTHSGVSESDPCWSPDGRYLYFAADRYEPDYPRGDGSVKIYRLALDKFDAPFRSDGFDKLFRKPETKTPGKPPDTEEKADTEAKPDAETEPEPAEGKPETRPETPAAPVTVTLDLEDLEDRWEQVSPDAGRQGSPLVIQKEDETRVLYRSNHDGEPAAVWQTLLKPFDPPKTSKIAGSASPDPALRAAGGKVYALVEGNIQELKLEAGRAQKIAIDFTFRKNLAQEFPQMFYETWANISENFYDETFHGVDWEAMKHRYEAFLPHLESRENLRTLINDMLGELNASHLGFRSSGKEETGFFGMKTLATGLLFDPDEPCKVRGIVRNTPLDKKNKGIRPGDVLAAVDGQPVDPRADRESYFLRPSLDPEVTLTFQRGAATFDVKIHPCNSKLFRDRLYDAWAEDNRRYVDEKSGRRVTYVHMKDMGTDSLREFLVDMTTREARDGLILDLRYNTGGNVHDEVLRFLGQRPYTQWKYRGGRFAPQPNFAPAARPIVLLVNEQSLSDAEMTAAGFKALKLGTVVGTETYRWLIFTSGKTLVDGSFYRLPSWGCYTLDGRDIETMGVAPDIRVQTTLKDRVEGRDPQLDRAVEEILRQAGPAAAK